MDLAVFDFLEKLGVAGGALLLLFAFGRRMLGIHEAVARRSSEVAQVAITTIEAMTKRSSEDMAEERSQRDGHHREIVQVLDTQCSILEQHGNLLGDIHRAVVPGRPPRLYVPEDPEGGA